MPALGRLLSLPVLGVFLTIGASAHADLPPPEGRKFVSYGFRVDNVQAFPDYVLLAFPCSTSSGVPELGHAVVAAGATVSVGRRGGNPQLYAMKRAEYETWKSTYKPPTDNYGQDPELTKLFESDKVVKCDGKPSPTFELASTDERSAVLETLRAELIDAKTCRIEVASAPVAPTPATNGPSPTKNAEPPAQSPASGGGCAGCATSPHDSRSSALAALLLGAACWLRLSGTSARSARRTSAR